MSIGRQFGVVSSLGDPHRSSSASAPQLFDLALPWPRRVAFTLQVYGHVLPGHQREAADAAAGLVD